GKHNLPVKVEPVSGALITTVEPDKIMVALTKLGENLLPINHQVIQKPPAGYQLLDVVVSPEKCLIRGEQNQIGRVTQVVCPVNLAGVTEVKSFTAGLEARDSNGNQVSGVELLPDKVQVYAVVQNNKTSQQLPVKVQFGGELGTEYELGQMMVEPETVTVLGDEGLVGQLVELETNKINISGHTESYTQEVNIAVPEGVKVYPDKVLVMVEIKKVTVGEE
ncbi:MAG: CdaR family protein, partial [Syntrophomonadaceae bacterium]|nr:CdaR family protein [Syntrophomonadaceae bacterium]